MPYLSVSEDACTCVFCRRAEQTDQWENDVDNGSSYEESEDFGGGLLSYSFRPRFIMHGEDGPPYYGLEIEHTCHRISKAVQIVATKAPPNLVYMKEDGSVDGYELVTHPMSYPWMMKEFPWQLIDELRRDARASVYEEGNGLHVHVSRNGFLSPSHLYRWMKLWYRNQDNITNLAGRDCSWGRFTNDHKRAQFYHAKKMMHPVSSRTRRHNSELDTTIHQRYAAINTMNDHTLEVRVFASSTDIPTIQGRVGLVAASVDYTKGLTANQVCLQEGWQFPTFMKWVASQDGKYEPLEKLNKLVN